MPEVYDSAELRRVLALPRRTWTPQAAADLARDLTLGLRAPGGTQELFPHQAVALVEFGLYGGLFAPLPVGAGKTLLSLLAPVVYAEMHQRPIYRPLVITKSALVEGTHAAIRDLRAHWTLPASIRVESFETLSRVNAALFLQSYSPDLVVVDEAHCLKNIGASSTRRIMRYLDAHAAIPVAILTGSPIGTSIKDVAHLVARALRHLSPYPRHHIDLGQWAGAIDLESREPFGPGALSAFGPDIRAGFAQRVLDTPGVVTMSGSVIDTPIVMHSHVLDLAPIQIQALAQIRQTGELPDGDMPEDDLALARAASEIALGFYGVWEPRPPERWTLARRAWAAACRDVVSSNRREIDSPEALERHLDEHPEHYPDAAACLGNWRAARPIYQGVLVARWISDSTIDWVVRRLRADPSPCVVWTGRPAFGERLAEAAGLPYYGLDGIDTKTGRHIRDSPACQVIASMQACGTGNNLQVFRRSIHLAIPRNPKTWEQLLGRMHRYGQRAESIECELVFGIVEDAVRFESACAHAQAMPNLVTAIPKLVLADTSDVHLALDLSARTGPQWRRK